MARSSAEAKFRSIAREISDVWIKRLLEDLKIPDSSPMKVYCDNRSTISVAHNPVLHDITKHVEVDEHFTKEKIDSGMICMPYVSTTEQIADILTKGTSKETIDYLISKLVMEDIFKPA